MSSKTNIIIFLSFSITIISFSSVKLFKKSNPSHFSNIQKKKKQIINQKSNNSLTAKKQKEKKFFFLITIIIVILIVNNLIWWIIYKNKKPRFNEYQIVQIAQIPAKNKKKYEKFKCGLDLDDNGINVIFCEHWDADAFFKKLWEFDVQNKCGMKDDPYQTNEFYFKASKANVKNKIKDFFDLAIFVLTLIDYRLLCRLNWGRHNHVTSMALNANKFFTDSQNSFSKFSITGISVWEGNLKFTEDKKDNRYKEHKETFKYIKQNNPFPFFKNIMKAPFYNIIYKGNKKNGCFFPYFKTFYDLITELQIDLKYFVADAREQGINSAPKENQELLKKIIHNKERINKFLE